MSLEGKRVVVIGGTSGIGLAVADYAARDGAQVTVASSRQETLDTALKRLPQGTKGHTVNVKDEADLAALFARVGAFDHLVYTAGDWGPLGGGAVESLDLARANEVFAVRFWGALAAVKHALKTISKDGSITLTDGMVAHRPRKGAAVNTAMAGAVEHLVRSLAVDLAPLRVNAVCPGAVRTEVWNHRIPEDERVQRVKRMTERLPIPRMGEPGEIAEAYLYLMKGGYTTGQVLFTDGGMSVV